MTNKALGKGLSALIPQNEFVSGDGESVLSIPIAAIKKNKYQPRLEFSKEKLDDLINSIKEKGVVQPVLVRKSQTGGYELIAGERRLRAVTTLGIATIPAIVKNVADIDMLELSLIENIQREELNAMEEAHAYQKFITDFNFTQDKIAKVLGKDRSTIANTIRLLGLPKKIQDLVSKNMLTAGHAKAILSLPTETAQLRLADIIIKKGMSVRETEKAVANRDVKTTSTAAGKDQNIVDIESRLQHLFGTRVRIFHNNSRGRIQIEYYSGDDLNRILDIFSAKKA
jgi:ParB family chromosome partitioning protein